MKSRRAWGALLGGLALLVLGTALAAADRLKTSADTRTVDSLDSGETAATCDGKAKAVSGGFENEFDPEGVVGGTSPQPSQFSSRRSGKRSWTGETFNIGFVAGDVTTYVYCRGEKLKSASKRATVEGTPFMSSDYGTGEATAKCPRGTKAVSGGFANPDFAVTGGPVDTRIIPYVSRRKGRRKWTVEAANYGEAEGTLVAYVYCHEGSALDKRRKSITLAPTSGDVAAGEATAKCPKGDRVVAGGFEASGREATLLASRKVGGRKWEAAATVGYPETATLAAVAYCEEK